MSTEILMPALSPTMEEGKLSKWLVKEGDTVKSGTILAEIETDKATMEFEAVDEGKIGQILVAEGTEGVKVNSPIATLLMDGEAPGAAPAKKAEAKSEAPKAEAKSEAKPETHAAPKVEVANDPEVPEGTEFVNQTVRDALRDAMAEEMRRDELVFLMGEEVAEYQGAYKISQGLLQEFGANRVIDTPITEHGFTGLAVGAGFDGLKPIVEFMTWNFAMQAMDQIINSAAKTRYMSGGQMSCAITFRGPNGAASRVGAQHSQDYAAWYASVPGMKVIAPYSAADAKGLLKAAIRDPNPVCFLENEMLYGRTFPVPKLDDFVLPIGKARICRPGKDVTIVAYSITVGQALEAAEKLAEDGIDAEVIDLRSLAPAGHGHGAGEREKDQPHRHLRTGLAGLLHRFGSLLARGAGGVRLSGRAAHQGVGQGRADALCRQSGKAGAAHGRGSDRGGEGRHVQGLSTMATNILMPALSPTMEEGKLAKWLVKEGDTVKSGTILAEIETDKATMEFEAVDEGKIGKILVPEGSEGVKVNAPIAVLLDEGEKMGDAPAAAPKQDIPAAMKDIGDAVKKEAAPARPRPQLPPAAPRRRRRRKPMAGACSPRRWPSASPPGRVLISPPSPAPARADALSNRMSRMRSQARPSRLLLVRRLLPAVAAFPASRPCPMRGCSIRPALIPRPRTTICARPSPSVSHRPRR